MYYDKKLAASKLRRWDKYLSAFHLPEWEEIPDIGLYMDQVIALLLQYLDFLPKDEKDWQVVTTSAINNYVRMRVIPAPVKRRYYRTHIAYLIMVCTLKQSLGIAVISKMIPTGITDAQVRSLYSDYANLHRNAARYFIEQVHTVARPVLDEDAEEENAVVNLAASAAVTAGFSRLLAEKLVLLEGVESDEPEKADRSEAK